MNDKNVSAVHGKIHNLIVENGTKITITGVNDVESYDETSAVMYTPLGQLTLKGSDFHVDKIDVESGEVNIKGKFISAAYSDNASQKSSFLSKLLR